MSFSKLFKFFKVSSPFSTMDNGIYRDLGIAAPYVNSYSLLSPFKGGNGHF